MDLSDRIAIETGILSKQSFKKIAGLLRRHPSTVAHEVKTNRTFIPGSKFLGKDCKWVRTRIMHHICGNIIMKVKDKGVPVMCCGQKMTEIILGTTDAAAEKHVPHYQMEGNLVKVNVGSVDHPMLPEHYIEWIVLKTKQGIGYECLYGNSGNYSIFNHKVYLMDA